MALFFLSSLLLYQLQPVFTVGVNRSIDDTLGDSVTGQRPTFLPSTSGVWEDNTCSGCALIPDISDAFARTYTAATYNPNLKNISISFDFTGTAIWIFFILANDPNPGISASTSVNFTLDGQLIDTFTHTPDTSAADAFYFNDSALAFSKTGMENLTHQMVISTSGLNSDYYLNFDYALYTFQRAEVARSSSSSATSGTPSPSSSSSSSLPSSSSSAPVGAIVGGAVGGIVVLALVVALLLCRRRRRRRLTKEEEYHQALQREIDPFILSIQPPTSTAATGPASNSLPRLAIPGTRTTDPRSTSTYPSAPSSEARAAGTGSIIPYSGDPKTILRQQRQQDLERQMQQIHDEIKYLQNEAAERNGEVLSHASTGNNSHLGSESVSPDVDLSSSSSSATTTTAPSPLKRGRCNRILRAMPTHHPTRSHESTHHSTQIKSCLLSLTNTSALADVPELENPVDWWEYHEVFVKNIPQQPFSDTQANTSFHSSLPSDVSLDIYDGQPVASRTLPGHEKDLNIVDFLIWKSLKGIEKGAGNDGIRLESHNENAAVIDRPEIYSFGAGDGGQKLWDLLRTNAEAWL
ncbi:hypothetical protein D9757_005067 [Collybiopsis confluens]|uniref:Uncharacterized protein n=1 Tax=Collybiopsis confluens TaxID=2823264 RepID=A0A8H5MCM0_9AGAR|nr:hypothetical protein D9757_005067 [Collybiopsis confluens]